MRLKERGPNEIGPYCNSIGGSTTFYFKKSEYDHVFIEILSKPIQNADLSWDECDSRYINKIHQEI